MKAEQKVQEETPRKKDWNEILGDWGVPVGVRRAAVLLIVAGLAAAGGAAYVFGYQNTADNIGPDPNLSCPGDFDVTKGVEMNKALEEYLALGTVNQAVEIGDDGVVEFDNGQLRLLREVRGGKKYTDPIGWSFTDKKGKVYSGWIGFSKNKPGKVCK